MFVKRYPNGVLVTVDLDLNEVEAWRADGTWITRCQVSYQYAFRGADSPEEAADAVFDRWCTQEGLPEEPSQCALIGDILSPDWDGDY